MIEMNHSLIISMNERLTDKLKIIYFTGSTEFLMFINKIHFDCLDWIQYFLADSWFLFLAGYNLCAFCFYFEKRHFGTAELAECSYKIINTFASIFNKWSVLRIRARKKQQNIEHQILNEVKTKIFGKMVDWFKFIVKVVKKTWKYGAAAATGYEAHEFISSPDLPPAPAPAPQPIINVPHNDTSLLWVILGVLVFMVVCYIGAKCVAVITMLRYSDTDEKIVAKNNPTKDVP